MENNSLKCNICGSGEVTAKERGFDGGNAALGGWVFGGMGLIFAGYKNSKDVVATCHACSNQWNLNYVIGVDKRTSKLLFYKYYESADYEQAEKLYLKNHEYDESVTDVHLAYSRLKKDDRKSLMVNIGFVAFVVIMVILIIVTN